MAAHHQVRNAAGRNGVRLGLSPRGLLKANDPRRTVTTILPNCPFCSRWRYALTISPNMKVRSMTGLRAPASSPLVMYSRLPCGECRRRWSEEQPKILADLRIGRSATPPRRAQIDRFKRFTLWLRAPPSPINRWTMAPIILGKPRPSNEKSSMRAISMIA
jgi:hypothetical protein